MKLMREKQQMIVTDPANRCLGQRLCLHTSAQSETSCDYKKNQKQTSTNRMPRAHHCNPSLLLFLDITNKTYCKNKTVCKPLQAEPPQESSSPKFRHAIR